MLNRGLLCLALGAIAASSCSKKDHSLPVANNQPFLLVDTTHWQSIKTGFTNTDFTDIWFTDSLHGFAAGTSGREGKIYSSSDGGMTWQEFAGPYGGLTDVPPILFFLDATHGYAASLSQLAVTTDGGQSWTIKPLTGVAAAPWGSVSLQFISPDTGYVSQGQGIYKTTDAGTTWAAVNNAQVNALFFTGSATGYIYYPADSISQTADGGTSWQPIASLAQTGLLNPEASYTSINYNQLQFIDVNHGWFMNGSVTISSTASNIVAVTANGGASWKSVTPALALGDPFMKLRALSSQTCFVAAANEIMQTTDGGSSWQINYQNYGVNEGPGSTPTIRSIYFTDANHGWASCTEGIVLRYVNH